MTKKITIKSIKNKTFFKLPVNPALSNMFTGYQIIGLLAIGSNGLGVLDTRSVIRLPWPAAMTTA